MYSINENTELVQAVLVLSRELLTDITVQIKDSPATAKSEYTILIMEHHTDCKIL